MRRVADLAVRAEQVRLVYSSPIILLLNLVNAAVAAMLFWTMYPAALLLVWLGLFAVVIPARILIWRRFQRVRPAPEAVAPWGLAATLGAVATGLLWGMLGSVLFVTAEPVYYVLVVFVLGGMTAGSALKDSAYLPSFYGFVAPAITPTVVALMARGGVMFDEMGLMLVAFTIVLVLVGRGNNRWITDSIRLRIEQAVLNADLQKASAQMSENLEILRRHQRDMASIAKLSDFLQACQTRGEAYPIITIAGARLFPGANGAVALLSSETQQLETVARWGSAPNVTDAFSVTDCWALRTGQRYEVPDPSAAPCCAHFETPPTEGYVCVPLTVQGETMGLLHLSGRPGAPIDDDTRALVQTFGDVVKLSLSNLKLRERLSDQAMRDQLTGLFNRHYLSETLPREIRRAQRDRTALTVAIADIDHFKTLNDTHGHAAGDLVLQDVGAFLRDSLRAGDIACRYGGEEFLLVLTECDLEEAERRLSQIRHELKLRPLALGGETLPHTSLSVGLALLNDELTTMESLINAADHALYEAKEKGRDRIEVYEANRTPAP